ncbi:MAG: hypothetical protein E7K72_00815 [Roseomonas mucosa]|nr:hypothetical protein [Roseomonas mucosa]
MIRSCGPLLAALLALPLAALPARAIRPELPFQPPATEAERALDAALRAADADPDLLSNLIEGRGGPGHRRTVDHSASLTPALVAAIARVERALVRRNCGGRYRADEICGLNASPLTCAQDSAEGYLYRTGAGGRDRAYVAYRWPGPEGRAVATYRLLRRGGAWRIDGVRCAEGGPSFNL